MNLAGSLDVNAQRAETEAMVEAMKRLDIGELRVLIGFYRKAGLARSIWQSARGVSPLSGFIAGSRAARRGGTRFRLPLVIADPIRLVASARDYTTVNFHQS